MTRIYLLLPMFEINVQTNNSDIINKVFRDMFTGCQLQDVVWINDRKDPDNENDKFQCAVKMSQFGVNFDQIQESIFKVRSQEATIARLKSDLFNMMGQYELVLAQKNACLAKMQKCKEEGKDSFEDASVSLKLQQKLKRSPNSYQEQPQTVEKQMSNAISQLTRQNIKLKDMISYYQAHIQFLMKGEQKTEEKKEDAK